MRPSQDEYFIRKAALAATRSTCRRRAVGCVLVDARGYDLATGYNGVPSGWPHCNEHRPGTPAVRDLMREICPAWAAPSGEGLDGCGAVHAEQNAILQCRDIQKIRTAYVTTFPCVPCTKLLLNTPCERIVYAEEYNGGQRLWHVARRKVTHVGL